jgi:hypothetical protein
MPREDLSFGFDTTFFEKGIDKVTKSMTGLKTTTGNIAKGISKGLTSVALKFGSVFAGVKAIQGALRNMPEIGQAFGIAKDIFLKNLLFPLRKQIFPLLQKMLDLVRDSRGKFVQWGNAIANVFKSVVSGVKTVIGFVRKMSQSLLSFTERIFGDQIKNVNIIFDLISFKLATVIQFVSILIGSMGDIFSGFFSGLGDISGSLRGIVDNLLEFLSIFTKSNSEGDSFTKILTTLSTKFGEIVGFIVRMTDKFLDGFVPAVKEIATPIQKILDAWINIGEAIFEATDSLLNWEGIFESLGSIIGTGIQKTFEFIATVLEDIEATINSIKDIGFLNTLTGQTESFFDMIKGKFKGEENSESPPLSVAASPALATSSLTNNNQQKNLSVNISPTIVIGNGTEAEGRNVAAGFADELRSLFNKEFERGGL